MVDQAIGEPSVRTHVADGVGRLTLDRPRAINALDIDMIGRLTAALEAWRDDADVRVVVLDGAGERGLCAGGDIRALYGQVTGRAPTDAAFFFRGEYALNAAIGEYPKPVVALADGITMGGGIGLAGHAAVRVVTERSRLAMPETRIGFTPDVGGTWLLGRAPGRLGEYLGVTGTVMDAADAVYAGFADLVVPADRMDELRTAIATDDDMDRAVRSLAVEPGASRLDSARAWIDDAFAADAVPAIIDRLRALGDSASLTDAQRAEAAATADLLGELSPTGMAITLEAVRRARTLSSLRDALAQEYGLVMWFVMTQPDLREGIRAQVIDKDRSPRWMPPHPGDVTGEVVASAFAFEPVVPLWS